MDLLFKAIVIVNIILLLAYIVCLHKIREKLAETENIVTSNRKDIEDTTNDKR
jgi:hypothetical protein